MGGITTLVSFCGYERLITPFNRMVKDERTCYFPELVSAHQHNSILLFKTGDQSVNQALPRASADSDTVQDKFLICWKVKSIRLGMPITPSPTFLDIDHLHSDSFFLKKPGLDPTHTIIWYLNCLSFLGFLAKRLCQNSRKFESDFWWYHSTETALNKSYN